MATCTNLIRDDGFGAQYQSIICAILCTELHGHPFAYSRPNLAKVYSAAEIEEMENLMNFRGNYPDADGSENKVHIQASYTFVEQNIDMCLKSAPMQNIKSLFRANKKRPFDTDRVHVAVHIRRPSISPTIDNPDQIEGHHVKALRDFSSDHVERFTRDAHFLATMDQIRSKHPTALFHVFSEGDPDLFRAFEAADVIMHLNEPATETFIKLVFADVLVTCKSSFSYVAALLSDGEVWYTPFWHRPASHWLKITS
jgi:hypothetical protein